MHQSIKLRATLIHHIRYAPLSLHHGLFSARHAAFGERLLALPHLAHYRRPATPALTAIDGHNPGREDGGGGYASSSQSLGLEKGDTRGNNQ